MMIFFMIFSFSYLYITIFDLPLNKSEYFTGSFVNKKGKLPQDRICGNPGRTDHGR